MPSHSHISSFLLWTLDLDPKNIRQPRKEDQGQLQDKSYPRRSGTNRWMANMTSGRRFLSYNVLVGSIVVALVSRGSLGFGPIPTTTKQRRPWTTFSLQTFSPSFGQTIKQVNKFGPLASSFYGKFDEEEDDEDEEEDDEDDYDLDDLDVASFRSKMSTLYDDGSSSSSSSSSSKTSSVDELINFARSQEGGGKPEVHPDWAKPTKKLEPGTVLLANPAKFCADFGTQRRTPSPSLLAKFGLTLPPPADLGPDRRADLLPVLIIVSQNGNSGGYQAVLLNRRTGYLLGDLDSPGGDSTSNDGKPTLSLEKFCIQPLWFGGVDNVSAGLDMLHQCPTVEDATLLTEDGLYWGGNPNQAQEAMSDSRLDRVYTGFDFKFFVQATVWAKGELEQHMEAENWFCAKVSKEVLFKSRDRMGTRKAKPLWAEIMELMGSPYKEVRDELYKQ